MDARPHRIEIPVSHQSILQRVAMLLAEHSATGWLVGGYVRDLLLGLPSHDIDLAVEGHALALARELADRSGGSFVMLDAATDSARVVWKTEAQHPDAVLSIDLVGLRAPTIDADLRLRDFTLNALALPLALDFSSKVNLDVLHDPTGGVSDLQARMIRACSSQSLRDDPLRALRGVRIAAQLDFQIADDTLTLIRAAAKELDSVAGERVRDELLRLFSIRSAAPWVVLLDEVGLLTRIMPELGPARGCAQPPQHFLPVLEHLFETVRAWEWLFAQLMRDGGSSRPAAVQHYPQLAVLFSNSEALVRRMQEPVMGDHARYALFKLAALLHDIGKPATQQQKSDGRITFYDHPEVGAEIVVQIARRLRLGRDATTYVALVVREHMRPGQLRSLGPGLTRRALYRLLRDTGRATPDVLLHSLCDHMAARGPYLSPHDWQHHVAWTDAILREDWVDRDRPRAPRLITGQDVINELGVTPGPLVGRVLAAVEEAYFLGQVQSRAEALRLAAQVVQQEQPASGVVPSEQ